MSYYVPATASEQREMLAAIGAPSLEALYDSVPRSLLAEKLDIPPGKSELEVRRLIEGMAAKNVIFPSIFRGAGAYNHYIPALVRQIAAKEEFLTCYTPYQPEISQGILQSIFEFQTMMCELTGLDAANASMYDGASAAAEATAMCRDRKRSKVLISAASHPGVIETIRTYAYAADAPVEIVPTKGGITDAEALAAMLDDSVACFYLQQPNALGIIEDAEKLGEVAHARGAKFIMGVGPIAAALLRTPAECGADVAVGEAQPLGLPLSFGGPYLGFMTATNEMARKLPGRIVGETVDSEGKRAFVLTLQAREQHIRREKASSNVCSNQAHCALTASIYLTVMGPDGLRSVAEQCYSKAHYAAERLASIPGFELVYPEREFFHEFVTASPLDNATLTAELEKRNILGGCPVPEGVLWCVTEMNTKEQIDELATALREASGR